MMMKIWHIKTCGMQLKHYLKGGYFIPLNGENEQSGNQWFKPLSQKMSKEE